MATQYPVRIEGEFVIQRATPLLCCCVSPAADLASLAEPREPSLHAIECWEGPTQIPVLVFDPRKRFA